MENSLKIAYSEVNQILDILGDNYKEKIPKKIIKVFKEKQDKNYKVEFNKNMKLEDLKISRTALIIISILNLKYWVDDSYEKERLTKLYKENQNEYDKKTNIYKQKNWLKDRYNKIGRETIESTNEIGLTIKKEYRILEKIKNFLKIFFD